MNTTKSRLSHKHIIAVFIVFNTVIICVLYFTVFSDVFADIAYVQNEIRLYQAERNIALTNYTLKEENLLQLEYLQQVRYIVHYHRLPHTLVNISNLMHDNGLVQSHFQISPREYVLPGIFSVNLTIGGTGMHTSIMQYIYSLNNKQELIIIDTVAVTAANPTTEPHAHVSLSIIVPAIQYAVIE